jgi:hypothetical protein
MREIGAHFFNEKISPFISVMIVEDKHHRCALHLCEILSSLTEGRGLRKVGTERGHDFLPASPCFASPSPQAARPSAPDSVKVSRCDSHVRADLFPHNQAGSADQIWTCDGAGDLINFHLGWIAPPGGPTASI